MLPRKNWIKKNGAIWRILSVPKYVIMNLKINKFKNTNSTTTKLFAIILSNTHLDVHVGTKVNIFTCYTGVLGDTPSESIDFFKSNELEASPESEIFKIYCLLLGRTP